MEVEANRIEALELLMRLILARIFSDADIVELSKSFQEACKPAPDTGNVVALRVALPTLSEEVASLMIATLMKSREYLREV